MKYTTEQISQINQSFPIIEYAKRYLDLNYHNGEYWSICPFHSDLNASLSFSAEKNAYKCFGCDSKGYLLNFVMQYHHYSFPQAIEHVLQLVNIEFVDKKFSEILEFLQKTNIKNISKEKVIRTYLPNDVMNKYTKKPIKEWLAAGISQKILDKYDVRYNENGNSIVFPIRDITGKIISIKARTLFANYSDLGIRKYTYYNLIGTNDFLFGLFENMKSILAKKELILLEGAKGVMLAESCGYNNCSSLETNQINDLQMAILLWLKVDVVICLDKGLKIVSNTKTKNPTEINIGLLPKLTNVYVMEDTEDLLLDKECPADRGKEIFDRIYERKYKII